jgi:hypothetical protein
MLDPCLPFSLLFQFPQQFHKHRKHRRFQRIIQSIERLTGMLLGHLCQLLPVNLILFFSKFCWPSAIWLRLLLRPSSRSRNFGPLIIHPKVEFGISLAVRSCFQGHFMRTLTGLFGADRGGSSTAPSIGLQANSRFNPGSKKPRT